MNGARRTAQKNTAYIVETADLLFYRPLAAIPLLPVQIEQLSHSGEPDLARFFRKTQSLLLDLLSDMLADTAAFIVQFRLMLPVVSLDHGDLLGCQRGKPADDLGVRTSS